MQHLTDSEVIRLVAGELSPAEAAAVRAHVGSCGECATRVREQESLWALLGTWEATRAVPDLTAEVLARLGEEPAGRSRVLTYSAGWRARWVQVGRIAAAMLIAAGAGHAVGRWTSPRGRSDANVPVPVLTADVVESLGLDAFALAPAGLDDLLDDQPDQADVERGQS
ncbi:MAG: anti-sigma factor family protein [Phycisphaerae bacterium]